MAVQACMKPKMMDEIDDDDDDDDVALVFKRSSTAPKQNQLNSETKKSSSHKHDKQSRNHVSEVHSSNGWNSVSQKGKPILSTKASPMKSHAASPKTSGSSFMASAVKSPSESPIGSTSFAKASPVKSPEVNSKVSTSAADQSRHLSQQNAPSTVKTEKQLINSSGEPHTDCEDSEDDKPLSDRFSAALPKGNPSHANKGSNTSNLGSPPLQKPGVKYEDSDDEMPLSSRFQLKPNVGPSSLGSPPLKKFGVKYEDSDDDIPLSSKLQLKPNVGPSSMGSPPLQNSGVKYEDSDDDIPLSSKLQLKPNVGPSSLGSSPLQKSGVKYEDSDDDIPLSSKLQLKPNVGPSSLGSPPLQKSGVKYEDSDDDIPLSSKLQLKPNVGPFSSKSKSYEFDENKPMLPKPQQNGSTKNDNQINISPTVLNKRSRGDFLSQSSFERPKLVEGSSKQVSVKVESKVDDDDDFVPLSQRLKNSSLSAYKSVCAREKLKKVVPSSFKKTSKKFKKVVKHSKYSKSSKLPPGSGEGQKWTTLVHNGVIFPPAYKPHGVKMLCKGQPVDLTPEQEEVATMFAVMLDTEYINKPKFKENFMNDWRKILGKNHVIQSLEDCDFSPIYVWHQREKEKKKQMSAEEKKALKEEKLKQEEKYMWAVVDGVKEKSWPLLKKQMERIEVAQVSHSSGATIPLVGNFRVEPPGLFRGRGEHPKMGKLKKRIRPSDIAINIGKGAPIPECPIPGERWKEIRHDNTVTWLAYWNDPINPKEFKYVFLAASSSLKGQSDKEKYEKARLLKDYIQGIRTAYTKDFASKDITRRQIAVATYLIDKLALRAGNEKDDDEADTVGCCTLKVENVEPMPPNILKFDFLGKDSIRYQNEVEVELPVFKAIQQFRTGKSGGDDLFDELDTSKLNAHLKELMPGLTAKVFRTYNASITLDEMLSRETKGGDVTEKVVVYQHANKEVAIICNHQRTVSKSHSAQMSRLNEKIEELKGILDGLKTDLAWAKKGKPQLKSADGKPRKNLNPEALERKIVQTNAKIEKMERDKKTKEDLKTVALGTSKINYLDPRITVAWCKRHEVPIEKIFNKSLLAKFTWAMDVDPSFRF